MRFVRLNVWYLKPSIMINIAFTQPDFGNTKLVGSYFKNFNKALFNWELNRQEDGQKNKQTRKSSHK
ncbi:MAG: hypothetical protein BroJett042_16170 [Bacteroidota bacterium]|nr:MAG: hypothetical protein BroJett042_16170 [Bacteroidota bacterium]